MEVSNVVLVLQACKISHKGATRYDVRITGGSWKAEVVKEVA